MKISKRQIDLLHQIIAREHHLADQYDLMTDRHLAGQKKEEAMERVEALEDVVELVEEYR